MNKTRLRLTFFFLSFCTILPLPQNVAGAPATHKVVGAYFEEWSIYGANYNVINIQSTGAANVLTHLYYAFANVSADGQCAIADSWADYQDPYLPSVNGKSYPGPLYGNFAALLQLKQLHPGLKVLISIGGASSTNSDDFSAAASTPAGRTKLASSCIDMFINGNVAAGYSAAGLFDGIDLDWEFPAAQDTDNFTALVGEFRSQLNALAKKNKTPYLLTMAAPAGSQNYSNIQLSQVASVLDYFNLETYDYHGTWETSTNHAAPLYESPKDPARGEGFTVAATVEAYVKANVPASKLVLGIPAYGRGWTGVPDINWGLYQSSTGAAPSPAGDSLATAGVATFRTLAALIGNGFTLHHDPISVADWLYSSSTQTFWSLDDIGTVSTKMEFAETQDLAGAFEWAIKDDCEVAGLIHTIAAKLNRSH